MGWRVRGRRLPGPTACSSSSTAPPHVPARSFLVIAVAAVLLAGVAGAAVRPPKVVATVRTGGAPIGLAVGAGSLWAANYGARRLERIDLRRNRVRARIALGNSPYAAAYGAGSVWVSSFDSAEVSRIDPATNRIVARINVGVEQAGLTATAPDVWGAVFGQGEVVRIDTATNSAKARIAVGGNPEDVVIAAGSARAPHENGTL